MDDTMKRKSDIEQTDFDRALSDAFLRDPECGAFGAIDDLGRRRMINDILIEASAAEESAKTEGEKKEHGYRMWIVGAAAGVVAAFVVVGILFWTAPSLRNAEESTVRETYFGEVKESDGDLYIGETIASFHAPLPVGQSIRTEYGAALLRLPTGIDWWMAEHGHARISSLDSESLDVEVLSGQSWFRVDKKREGPSFSVKTKMGRVFVKGTIFVVDAGPSDTRVTVLEGKVRVERASGRSDVVGAGDTMYLREGSVSALADKDRSLMYDRLTELAWDDGTAEDALSAKREITDDSPDSGRETAREGSRTNDAVEKTDIRRLHEEIQASRKKGDWKRVAALYLRLIQSAPGSEAAIVSRVSLGEIYLAKLHRYGDALSHFDKYLSSGHTALLPEALYGRCRALMALGKSDEEAECLERFVTRFQGAFQAREARSRLLGLRGDIRE